MSQKSSVPQAVSFVSQLLKRDTKHEAVVMDLREILLRSPSDGGAFCAAGANLNGDQIVFVRERDNRVYTRSLISGEFKPVGELPPPKDPFEAFTTVGILSKLGPVAYRPGTGKLYRWTEGKLVGPILVNCAASTPVRQN
jgi:hypothetical protein